MGFGMEKYWKLRLENCKKALERNNFEAFVADSPTDAKNTVINRILPEIEAKSAAWGDSMTLHETGLLDYIREHPEIRLIETFAKDVPYEELTERRREALSADLFLTGSNAVTESGVVVNLDSIGNRAGGIVFGPKHVVLMIGRNKIVSNIEEAMKRIKNLAAPANAIRHGKKTPCVKTSYCFDCKSPERICNVWTIHEKSKPPGRIKVILINADLGL